MKKSVEPSTNLALSMRDMGYTLETALADVVDNSISAGASQVRIIAPPLVPLRIAIIDDGKGMSEEEIQEALILADSPPSAQRTQTDLGRFGMGMKTASWSQCRRLSVVSAIDGHLWGATIDLDEIQESGRWEADFLSDQEVAQLPYTDELGANGTLILWEKVDRLEQPTTDLATRHLAERLDDVRAHLALVFHRFLAYEPGFKSIGISVNNNPLEAFDPFNSRHPATQQAAPEVIPMRDKGDVRIQAFTLPHHSKVSREENEYYAGAEGYLRNQGFYLYRQRRLILRGTWFRLTRQHPSLNLSRIRIDIPNTMDDEWQINIMKASAQPPRIVRDRLKQLLNTLGRPARRVYQRKGYNQTLSDYLPVWGRSVAAGQISYQIQENHPLIEAFREGLDSEQARSLRSVLRLIASSLPIDALFVDIANGAETVQVSELDIESLKDALAAEWPLLVDVSDGDEGTAEEILLQKEPYRSNQEVTLRLLEEMKRYG